MRLARFLITATCAAASAACGTEVAMAVYSTQPPPTPQPDAGPTGIPEKPPQCASTTLASRISQTRILVNDGIRYKRIGTYFFGFPQDDRIALSTNGNEETLIAWLNSAGTHIHVTPISRELTRVSADLNDDVVIEGTELSGLVALDNGFAVLTRRPDTGDPIGDNPTSTQAAYLVRWQDGRETFAVPLTGTKSITTAPDNEKRDYPLPPTTIATSGRLVFNGSQFGAYFGVRGGLGDRYEGLNSDKLVQVNTSGQYVGGWRVGCRQNLGGRLVPEANGFTAFCMSDGYVGSTGINVVLGARSTRFLVPEDSFSSNGYAGGNLGSVVKTTEGYMIAWASRGVRSVSGGYTAAHDSHEPAVAVLTKDATLAKDPVWPFLPSTTPEPREDTVNVHAAPYGDKAVLFVWETIASPQFRASSGLSTGDYGGTHLRLVDVQGIPASKEEVIPDAIAPNGPDEIVQFPNGDLVWANVVENRNFQSIVMPFDVPALPQASEIKLIRLSYCVP